MFILSSKRYKSKISSNLSHQLHDAVLRFPQCWSVCCILGNPRRTRSDPGSCTSPAEE